jgi:hypothetical protein
MTGDSGSGEFGLTNPEVVGFWKTTSHWQRFSKENLFTELLF